MKQYTQSVPIKKETYNPVDNVRQEFFSSPTFLKTQKEFSVKNSFEAKESETIFKKGQSFGRTAVSGAVTTVSTSSYLIGVTALAVATSIGLPNPSQVGVGKTYIIKDEAGGATTTNITIRSEGEKTIDGASSTTLSANYQVKRFYTDGSNWFTC